MNKRPDVYICSKPLQYFNIKNISTTEDSNEKKVLFVIDAFINAADYVNRIKLFDKEWDNVYLFKDLFKGLNWILKNPVHNLYVDNDMSWQIYCLSLFGRIDNLYVYEEGIGSYSNKQDYEAIYQKGGLLRDFFRKIFGMGFHHGDSIFCKGVFLYKPDLYNRKFQTKKGQPFEMSFMEHLLKNEDLFLRIGGGAPEEINVRNKKILIYITEWKIKPEVLDIFKKEASKYDLCIIKPHPHIKHLDFIASDNIKVLNTPIMVEMILSFLLRRGNKLTVWHHYSTSVVQFHDYVECVPLSEISAYEKAYQEYINA